MKKISICLFLTIFLTVTSCDLFNKSTFVQSLNGTWSWERTTGGFGGIIITPDSVNYTQKLIISDEGKAFLYRNDELRATWDVKFEKPEWYEQKTWTFYRKKDSRIQSYISALKDGKLVLKDNCADCYTKYFSRK